MKFFPLALAGLVSLFGLPALALPGTNQTRDEKPTYPDTGAIRYHCIDEGFWIVQCHNTNIGGCKVVTKCLSRCREALNGVWCTSPADPLTIPPTEEKRDPAVVKKDDLATQPDDKPYRQCSADHTGVQTCYEGFCNVQPGNYCTRGKKCHDDCACCKKH